MAIVRASYTRNRGLAKANVRYIAHRRNKDREKVTRELFSHDGPLTKEQIYEMIDKAPKGTWFYRFKMNFHPTKEDWDKQLDMQEITLEVMRQLERRLKLEGKSLDGVQFVAALHPDHTDLRHVHILALIPGKLQITHLKELTKTATKQAAQQRQRRDQALEAQAGHTHQRQPIVTQHPRQRDDLIRGAGRPRRGGMLALSPSCPRCETPMGLFGNLYVCGSCGLRFAREKELTLEERGSGRGW